MSTWISDEKGVWHPAKERVPLYNRSDKAIEIEQTSSTGEKFKQLVQPGASYIYEGPDRSALFNWWEENGRLPAEEMKKLEGNVTLGEDFRVNTEFREQFAKARQMFGFNTVDEYLTYLGYDAKKSHERFLEKASVVAKHDMPSKVAEIKKLGGGQDYATGKLNRYGGFGDAPNVLLWHKQQDLRLLTYQLIQLIMCLLRATHQIGL